MEVLQMSEEKPSTKDKKELKTELPSMTHDFDIDVIGDITAKRYLGTFTCKIMNQKETALVAKHKALLNGPQADGLDPVTLLLHHRIAYLRFALKSPYPKFWLNSDLGYELFDVNVIDAIFSKVLEWEEVWMIKVWGKEAIDKMRSQ